LESLIERGTEGPEESTKLRLVRFKTRKNRPSSPEDKYSEPICVGTTAIKKLGRRRKGDGVSRLFLGKVKRSGRGKKAMVIRGVARNTFYERPTARGDRNQSKKDGSGLS